jgi:hypothetical protein
MAAVDGVTLAARDSLAVVVTRPSVAADAVERPLLQARREAQQAAAQPRLTAASAGGSAGPSSRTSAATPARVEATLAADRALFTVLTAGRQFVTEQANLMAAQNAARFLPFTALLGSSTSVPAMPATRQRTSRVCAARAASFRGEARQGVRDTVSAAYADPRDEGY